MVATTEGVKNCQAFMFYAGMSSDDLSEQVKDLAAALDWEGVVALAQGSGFAYDKKPFTPEDAEAVLDAFQLVALPDDFDGDAAGAFLLLRPQSKMGFVVLSGGGVTATSKDKLLATSDNSLDAGTPVGEPRIIPLIDAKSGGISSEDSPWMISETSKGHLAFFRGDKPIMVVRSDGRVWAVQHPELKEKLVRHDGYFKSGGTSSVQAGADLMPLFAGDAFSLAQTDAGHLVFRYQLEDKVVMIATGSGKLWGAAEGGYFKTDDMSFDWDVLWAHITVLWGDVTDALGQSWDWVEQTAEDAWGWLEDAVGDAWDWVEDTAGDVWSTITDPDTWNPANWV